MFVLGLLEFHFRPKAVGGLGNPEVPDRDWEALFRPPLETLGSLPKKPRLLERAEPWRKED